MKRKFLGLMLVVVMVFTSLTGCSEPVTAESLVDGAFSDVSYMECEINMDLEMEVSASGMSVDFVLGLAGEMEISEEVTHMVLSMDMDLMGMSESMETEMYTVTEKDTVTTYTYDETYGQWTYVESEVDEDAFMEMSSDMFEDLEMEKTDGGYVVTGKLTEMKELLEGVNFDEDTFGEYMDLFEDVEILVTMTFDKDKLIEEMELEFDIDEDDVFEIEGVEVTISKIEAKAEYKNVNDDEEVEIPDDVIDEAVEAGNLDGDDFFEDDTEYDTEDDYYVEDTEEIIEIGYEMAPIGGITGTNPPSVDNIYFTFKGTEYTFDTLSLDVLKSLGYEVEDYSYTEGAEYYLNAGEYEYISLCDENICYVDLYYRNHTDSPLDILACDVIGFDVDQSYEMEYEGGAHCDFSIMGIAVGTATTDVENILGTPDEYYVYDNTITYYYYLDNNYDAQLALEFLYGYGLTGFEVYEALYD